MVTDNKIERRPLLLFSYLLLFHYYITVSVVCTLINLESSNWTKQTKERKRNKQYWPLGARMTIAGCVWKWRLVRLRVSFQSQDNRLPHAIGARSAIKKRFNNPWRWCLSLYWREMCDLSFWPRFGDVTSAASHDNGERCAIKVSRDTFHFPWNPTFSFLNV